MDTPPAEVLLAKEQLYPFQPWFVLFIWKVLIHEQHVSEAVPNANATQISVLMP